MKFGKNIMKLKSVKARQVQTGDDISIITNGMGVIWAEDYAAEHPEFL